MAHVRQSGPDPGLGFQVKVFETLHCVPSWLENGSRALGVPERSVATTKPMAWLYLVSGVGFRLNSMRGHGT